MSTINKTSEYLVGLFGHLVEPPMVYWIVTGVIALVTLWVYYTYRRSTQGIIPFKTQGGTIEIAPSTLRGVMQHAANSVEGVERASCRHFLKGRRVGVKVAIHLRANNRLKDVESQIKHCIRATLYEQFGMETIDPIHIRVTRIVGEPIAARPEFREEELAEAEAGLLDPEADDDRPYADETTV